MMTLLFVGFDFHQRTGSADFFLSLLRSSFHVSCCYVNLYDETPYTVFSEFTETAFDVLVCWQVMPPRDLLDAHFKYKHAVFVPMFDGCPSVFKTEKWFPYRDFQMLSFSRLLGKNLKKAGFSVKYVQFFPLPSPCREAGDPKSAFLWCRRERIGITLVEHLFSNLRLRHIHVHKAPDPGSQVLPPSPNSPIEFTYSTWYVDRQEMRKDIEASAYYIAPRPTEGIGMSFLEAMAMGKCVIAPDNPTMNEYITHNRTGLLYNLRSPKPFRVVDVRAIQKQTYLFMCEGYQQWEKEKQKICDWIIEPVDVSHWKMFFFVTRRLICNPIKVIRMLKAEFRRLNK